MIELHILNKSRGLDPFLKIIEEVFDTGIKKIQAAIPVDNFDVVVTENSDWAVLGTGVGGRAYTQYLVEIFIDPLQKDLNRTLPAELLGTLAHEIHHVARTATIGFGETLLEACVSDGLADHFQDEITGSGPRPWDIALDDESLVKMRNLAEKEFYTEYDRKEWFFGSGPRDIPRWTGYSLGFHIVGEYLKRHPDQTAAKLYATPAQEFIN